jgi:hypothetical protein
MSTVQYDTRQYNTIKTNALQYNTINHDTQHSKAQHHAIRYNTKRAPHQSTNTTQNNFNATNHYTTQCNRIQYSRHNNTTKHNSTRQNGTYINKATQPKLCARFSNRICGIYESRAVRAGEVQMEALALGIHGRQADGSGEGFTASNVISKMVGGSRTRAHRALLNSPTFLHPHLRCLSRLTATARESCRGNTRVFLLPAIGTSWTLRLDAVFTSGTTL